MGAAVRAELDGSQPSMARVRKLMERALEMGDPLQRAALWRLYISTASHLDSPSAVKRLCQRAVESCPFSKHLWVSRLRIAGGEEEAMTVLEDIYAKEISLRTDP